MEKGEKNYTKGSFIPKNYFRRRSIEKKWNQPLSNWAITISQLDIFFPQRLAFNG
jgi:hypothetical protein